MEENKVTYGLENVHYAVITSEKKGKIEYATPKPIPGGVEISLEPKGEIFAIKADNIDFYKTESNEGYEGTLKVVNLPEAFKQEVLGEKVEGGLTSEYSNAAKNSFALLFQFEGDAHATRHVLYNCTAKRPKVTSTTKDGNNYNTDELSFSASPRSTDKVVKRKTNKDTPTETYNKWFEKVPEIEASASAGQSSTGR